MDNEQWNRIAWIKVSSWIRIMMRLSKGSAKYRRYERAMNRIAAMQWRRKTDAARRNNGER